MRLKENSFLYVSEKMFRSKVERKDFFFGSVARKGDEDVSVGSRTRPVSSERKNQMKRAFERVQEIEFVEEKYFRFKAFTEAFIEKSWIQESVWLEICGKLKNLFVIHMKIQLHAQEHSKLFFVSHEFLIKSCRDIFRFFLLWAHSKLVKP